MSIVSLNHSSVDLIDFMASDDAVIQAARVSAGATAMATQDQRKIDPYRFINALMSNKHGSPFEHTSFKFLVKVPIFVAREWQRHRIGSFNEVSGRYTQLKPEFYIPDAYRPLGNVGTSMKPEMTHLEPDIEKMAYDMMVENSLEAWGRYQELLKLGASNEVARMVLPLNVFTSFYWTVNARALMNFLSLRVHSEDSSVVSYPQHEINQPAIQVEAAFARVMPVTHLAFVNAGRVSP